MDVFTDISAVQNRIAEITGNTGSAYATPAVSHGNSGAFARMVDQAMGGGNANPMLGMPAPMLPYGGENGLAGISPGPAPVPPAEIDRLVTTNATQYGVDPALVKAIIANESSFNANATSPVGAQGLMQLMPETAAGVGVTDAYDPAQNVAGGTRYLKSLLDRFGGDVRLAVAAYNAGPGAVEKYNGVPPYAETQNYVGNVLGSYRRYRT